MKLKIDLSIFLIYFASLVYILAAGIQTKSVLVLKNPSFSSGSFKSSVEYIPANTTIPSSMAQDSGSSTTQWAAVNTCLKSCSCCSCSCIYCSCFCCCFCCFCCHCRCSCFLFLLLLILLLLFWLFLLLMQI